MHSSATLARIIACLLRTGTKSSTELVFKSNIEKPELKEIVTIYIES